MGKSTGSTSSGSGNSTQTVTKTLPSWAQGTAESLLKKGSNVTSSDYTNFPYVTVYDDNKNPTGYKNLQTGETFSLGTELPYTSTSAAMNDYTKTGLDKVWNRALEGSPITSSAQTLANDTLSGKYLDPSSNPYLEATYQAAADDITNAYQNSVVPQLTSYANRAGAFGGSSDALLQGQAMRSLGKSLSDTATDLYGTNYSNERTNQLKALGLSPTIANMDYTDLNALLGVGDVYNTYGQNALSDLYNQWSTATSYPYSQLDKLASYLSSSVGDTGTTTSTGTTSSSTPTSSLASSILGSATKGAGTGLLASTLGASTGASTGLGLLSLLGSLL